MNRTTYNWPSSLGVLAGIVVPGFISPRVADTLPRIEQRLTNYAHSIGDLSAGRFYDFCVGVVEDLNPPLPDTIDGIKTAVLALSICDGHRYRYVFKFVHQFSLAYMKYGYSVEKFIWEVQDKLLDMYLEYNVLAGIRVMKLDREYAESIHPNPTYREPAT